MKKSLLITVLLILMLTLLIGCKSVAGEKQLKSDLEAYTKSDIFDDNERITDIKIYKRQTEKDKKLDSVWCTVSTEDDRFSYEKEMTLTYVLYDEGGWILDNVSIEDRGGWVITPLTGISENDIISSLSEATVIAGDEIWYISSDNIKTLSIEKQKTDLEEKTDTVTVSLTIDDQVMEASGRLEIRYVFNDKWEIASLSGNEDFTATMKPGVELSVTNEVLINELSKQTFEYGIQDYATLFAEAQVLSINKNEISDFEIKDREITEKGTVQTYICSCTLSKPLAEFTLDITIPYSYINSSNWSIQPISITAKCNSINLSGEWGGTYGAVGSDGSATLNLTDVDNNDSITGTFKYVPNSVHAYSQPGSYKVTGEIDLSTLKVHFTAGNWIVNPGDKSNVWDNSDISATLDVENSVLYGTAPGARTVILKK